MKKKTVSEIRTNFLNKGTNFFSVALFSCIRVMIFFLFQCLKDFRKTFQDCYNSKQRDFLNLLLMKIFITMNVCAKRIPY